MSGALYRHLGLHVKPCEFGWGVFTNVAIPQGELLEQCHFLALPHELCTDDPLKDYVFRITNTEDDPDFPLRALVLGWGSIFNHSEEPNVEYVLDTERRLFEFWTSRPVKAGEQLCVSYGPAWWKDRGISPE